MFSKSILIGCVCFVMHTARAQEIRYPYKHDLKGSVRECSEKKFAVTFASGTAAAGDYKPDDKLGIRSFDRAGNLVEFRTQPDEAGKCERTVITYNASGCWQELTEYRGNDVYNASSVFQCDGKGNVIEQVDFFYLEGDSPTTVTSYKYDDAGHITETHKRWGDPKQGSTKSAIVFVKDKFDHVYYGYDKNGFLIRWSIKREGIDPELAALFSGEREFTNDTQGRSIAEYSLNDLTAQEKKSDKKKLSREMVYNAEGFLAQKVEYNNFGRPDVTYYDYTYDDHGNWITKTELKATVQPGKANATPHLIFKREILYY